MGRNLFEASRKWLCRSLLLTALAGTTMIASCGDDFDDSELKNRIDQVENRLSQLETKLNGEIEALQQLLNGKSTIASATKADGVWTIVLSDGQTITVGEAGSAPVISVVEENGTYYWTLDGQVMTDASGEKISVEGGAPSLRVDAATKEWLVSPDGGKTWFGTGIKGENASLFQKVAADDDYVYFTLADGTELAVAKGEAVANGFSLKFLVGGKQYVEAGQTKTVAIDMTGVKKASVIGKPDGWKASVKDGKLSITAPAANAVSAEKEGVIVVMAISNDGKSDLAELPVKVGKADFTLSVNGTTITLVHNSAVNESGFDEGNYFGAILGASKLADFSPETVIANINADPYRVNAVKSDYTGTLAQLIGTTPARGDSYVVWAVPYDYWGDMNYYQSENVVYATIVVPTIEFTAEAAFDNAQIKVVAKGVTSYVAEVKEKSTFDAAQTISDINEFGTYDLPTVNGNYEGLLSNFAMTWGMPNQLTPGNTYVVYALPIERGKTYTEDDLFVWEVELSPITFGGKAAVTVSDPEITMTSVKADITPGSGIYKYYAEYLTAAEMENYADDAALVKWLAGRTGRTEAFTLNRTNLTAGTKGWIAAVALSRDGQAGPVVKVEANTPEMKFNDIVITAELVAGNQEAWVKPSVTGGEVATWVLYYKQQKQFEGDFAYRGDVKKLESAMSMFDLTAIPYGYFSYSASEVGAEGIYLPASTQYGFNLINDQEYIVALLAFDAQGMPSRIFTGKVTPTLALKGKRIRSTDAAYMTGIPTITSCSYPDGDNIGKMACTFTMGSGSQETYLYIRNREAVDETALIRTKLVVADGKAFTQSGSFTSTYYDYYVNTSIFFAWVDADGNTHDAAEIRPFWGQYIAADHAGYAKNKPSFTGINDKTKDWVLDTTDCKQVYTWTTDKALNAYGQFAMSEVLANGTLLTGNEVTVADGQKLYVVWVDADGNTHQPAEITK